MPVATARLPDWLDEEIRAFWAQHGEGPSSALRRVAEEWWTYENCPHLEFRDGVAGRRAAIRGGPDVWEVAAIAADCGENRQLLEQHFGGFVSSDALTDAMRYWKRFPEDVTRLNKQNQRMAGILERTR